MKLDDIDPLEAVEGYRDYSAGWPCGDNRSPSYRRGWMNARNDKASTVDAEQRALAREYVKRVSG